MTYIFSITKFISLGFSLFIFSTAASGIEFRQGENVDVSGQFSQNLFLSGEQIRSEALSTDDIFMAGGNITQIGGGSENIFVAGGDIDFRSPKARLAVIAGGNISMSQTEFKDLILAGGKIQMDQSLIQDDVVLAGGQIEIGRDSRVADSVALAGGEIHFAGSAGGDVEISGNQVELTGTFAKNVRVRADRLVVGPNAQITGNLLHQVNRLDISPLARIQGRQEALPLVGSMKDRGWVRAWAFFAGLLFFIGVLLAPALVSFIFPGFVQTAAHRVRAYFWECVGKGTVAFIAGPILLFFLFASVIGVPVALFAIPFFVVAALMAWSIATFSAARQLRSWYRQEKQIEFHAISRSRVLAWTAIGGLVLMIGFLIPLIGMLLCLILFLAGLGSIYLQIRESSFQPRIPAAESKTSGNFVAEGTHA